MYIASSSRCPLHQMRDARSGIRWSKPQERKRMVVTDEGKASAGETDSDIEGEEMAENDELDFPRHSCY